MYGAKQIAEDVGYSVSVEERAVFDWSLDENFSGLNSSENVGLSNENNG
jgi:hypothetical protein